MHAIVFTGGIVRPSQFTKQAVAGADLIIAADSGGRAAIDMGVFPSVVIGDFDSLDEKAKDILKQKGCQFITHDSEKDKTDTELAIRYAIAQKAGRITVIGGIEGNRLDHILSNIFSVMDVSVPVKFVNDSTTAWVEKGPTIVKINGKGQDLLSLIPLTNTVSGVETKRLKYTLQHETLYQNHSRGISNVLLQPDAKVKFVSGTLLFVHISVD